MTDEQIPANNAASAAMALALLGQHTSGDALTPITVLVRGDGPEGDTHYGVMGVRYDRSRDEFVLTIDQSAPAPGRCGFTTNHTRQWCGNPRCRER